VPDSAVASAPLTMRDYLRQQAEKSGIPADLALAIVDTESGGTHSGQQGMTTSRTGAKGFFQLMPETAKELGVDPMDPFQNIDGGLRYFKQQLDAHKGDVRLALAAYNAGPARTTEGTVPQIPETQDYVLKVLQAWQRGSAAPPTPKASARKKVATKPPAAATAGMMPPSPKQKVPLEQQQERPFFERAVLEPVSGFGKGVAGTIADLGSLTERVTGLNLPDLPEGDLTPRTTGEKVGQFAERTAEFALPGEAVTATRKGMQITAKLVQAGVTPAKARLIAAGAEGVGQALTAAGISTVHGDDPETAAIIAGAAPVFGTALTQMAPIIRQGAITRMARFMERGVRGEITPYRMKEIAQAAQDFIDLPLKRTWRQMAAQTGKIRAGKTETLKTALAGPLGDVPVPKAPVVKALDDLITDAQHYKQVKGGIQAIDPRKDLVHAVGELQELLGEYGDTLPARDLHDLKSIWWKKIFPIKEEQPIRSLGEQLTNAQKEAHLAGAASIMRVLETDAPQIAKLDSAVHHAAILDKYTRRLAVAARTSRLAKPAAAQAVGAVGGAVGMAAGSTMGHPWIGANIGWATSRMLMGAIESPRWRLIPMATRRSLASALASGKSEQVRKILTPIVLANTAAQDDLVSASSSASASR